MSVNETAPWWSIPIMMSSFVILDTIWFKYMYDSVYAPVVSHLEKSKTKSKSRKQSVKQKWWLKIVLGILVYGLISVAIQMYVLIPSVNHEWYWLILYASIFAIILYGVYDITNMFVFFPYWNWKVSLFDMIWGLVAVNIVTQIGRACGVSS